MKIKLEVEVELTAEQVAAIAAQARAEQAVQQAVQSGLRPGYVVADVGGGKTDDEAEYVGTLNPDTLDRLDWAARVAFAAQLPGDYDLFDRKPWIGNRATGELLHAGDLASADLSGYYLKGSVLGPYLK